MGYKFNPFTGNLDTVDSPNGVFEAVEVNGDITLDDGGTFTTTLQTITPTANRTVSLPDATGTVALVAGSSGQLVYNNAGAQAGAPGSVVGATGDVTLGLNGAASTPPLELTGTWFTGGTATTTKPQVLIEPAGTTSTAWSTSGTGLGVNAASAFTGRLLDLQTNGTSRAVVTGAGSVGIGTTSPAAKLHVSGADSTNVSFNGTTKGVRFDFDATQATIYGVDNTFFASFQPLKIGGSYTAFAVGGSEAARLDTSSRLLVGTTTNTGGSLLQVNDNRIRIATAKTPASATDTGSAGEICWDASYIYVCTATNTWKRVLLLTW